MLYTMNFAEIDEFKPLLLEIGKKSMSIINESRVQNGDFWEAAIEINLITHRLHDSLDRVSWESGCKEDPTQYS